MRVLAALDKFKGTATSREANSAVVRAATALGHDATGLAMSDGGDGLLEVFGGATRSTPVTGPDGRTVTAAWRLANGEAVIESALASGLVLVGGPEANDAVAATSRGTGELVEAAVRAGATRVVVGLGGSASSDGGLGAVAALSARTLDAVRSGEVELDVCCDVDTVYTDAARVFGPQKGATPAQVQLLTHRLRDALEALRRTFGVDVSGLPGSGAAGGLGGGLAAAGGRLRSGFDVVAAHVGLAGQVARADVVVTGEGRVDESSFAGKVVGGVARCGAGAGVPVAVLAGVLDVDPRRPAVSLVSRFGVEAAMNQTVHCLESATTELLAIFLG